MMRSKHLLVLVGLLWLGAGLALAQPAAVDDRFASANTLPVDAKLRKGILENGLRYYIRENRRPENRVELRLAVNAGSILEDENQRGLAHFVEHMAFNGTENFKKQALVAYLESIGMRMGSDLNAYTSFDETVYMLQVPMDNPEHISTAFQIMEDWSKAITLDGDELFIRSGV